MHTEAVHTYCSVTTAIGGDAAPASAVRQAAALTATPAGAALAGAHLRVLVRPLCLQCRETFSQGDLTFRQVTHRYAWRRGLLLLLSRLLLLLLLGLLRLLLALVCLL